MAKNEDRPIYDGVQYFIGKPCKCCGYTERYIKTKKCIKCNRDYSTKLRTQNKECYRAYQIKHREVTVKCGLIWRSKNPEKVREYKKQEYRRNKDKRLEKCREWRLANLEKTSTYHRNRKARIKNSKGKHSGKEIKELLKRQKYKCAECLCRIAIIPKNGESKLHVDHIMPVALNGSNDIKNLQCLCQSCNLDKGSKHPIEYAQRKGRLL